MAAEDIIVRIALSGQSDVLAAIGTIGEAGETAFASLERALLDSSAALATFGAALTGIGAGLFMLSESAAASSHSLETLASASGMSVENLSSMQGALASMGASTENLGLSFRRLSMSLEREWDQIVEITKKRSNQVIDNQHAVAEAANSVIQAQEGIVHAEQAVADFQRTRQQTQLSAAQATLSVESAQLALEKELARQGMGEAPSQERENQVKLQEAYNQVAEAKLRQAEAQQRVIELAQKEREAVQRQQEAYLKLAEAQQKQKEVLEKQHEDEMNDLGRVTTAVEKVINGYARMADVRGEANLSVDNIMKGLTISSANAENAIKNFSGNIGDLQKLTPNAQEAFMKLADFMKNSGDAALNQALSFRFLSRNAQELTAVMTELGSSGMKQLMDKFKELGFFTSDAEAAIGKRFTIALATLRYELRELKDQLGAVFAPTFTEGLNTFREFIENNREAIVNWARSLEQQVRPIILDFFNLISGQRAVNTTWMQPLADGLKKVAELAYEALQAVGAFFIGLTGGNTDAVTEGWLKSWVSFGAGVKSVVEGIISVLKTLYGVVDEGVKRFNEAFGTNFSAGGIAAGLVIAKLTGAWGLLVATIGGVAAAVRTAIAAMTGGEIIAAASAVGTGIGGAIIAGIASAFSIAALGAAIGAGLELLGEWIGSKISDAIKRKLKFDKDQIAPITPGEEGKPGTAPWQASELGKWGLALFGGSKEDYAAAGLKPPESVSQPSPLGEAADKAAPPVKTLGDQAQLTAEALAKGREELMRSSREGRTTGREFEPGSRERPLENRPLSGLALDRANQQLDDMLRKEGQVIDRDLAREARIAAAEAGAPPAAAQPAPGQIAPRMPLPGEPGNPILGPGVQPLPGQPLGPPGSPGNPILGPGVEPTPGQPLGPPGSPGNPILGPGVTGPVPVTIVGPSMGAGGVPINPNLPPVPEGYETPPVSPYYQPPEIHKPEIFMPGGGQGGVGPQGEGFPSFPSMPSLPMPSMPSVPSLPGKRGEADTGDLEQTASQASESLTKVASSADGLDSSLGQIADAGSNIESSLTKVSEAADNLSFDSLNNSLQSFGSSLDSLAAKLASFRVPSGGGGGGEAAEVTAAGGGLVHGPGTGTSDSIDAKVSRGEYIHQEKAVAHYGVPFMHAINKMQLPRFNLGGLVGEGIQWALMPPIPRFAGGGLVEVKGSENTTVAGGGHPLVLNIDGKSLSGMSIHSEDTARQLAHIAINRSLRSGGRKQSWYR